MSTGIAIVIRGIGALAVVALSSSGALADDGDPASMTRRLAPRNDTVYLTMFQIYQPGLSSRDFRISLGAPVIRGDGYGIGFFARSATTSIESDQLRGELELHRFELMLGGGAQLAPGWPLRGALGVAYASDLHLDGLPSDAFQLTAAALINHALGASDAVTFGLAYASSSSFYPLLPILGYVHQSAGSPFRFDAQLPHHVRASYQLTPRLQAALALEAHGDKWLVRGMRTPLETRRDGGSAYGELDVAATGPFHVALRLGVAVDRYTLPDTMADTSHQGSLGLSGFGQLLLFVAH